MATPMEAIRRLADGTDEHKPDKRLDEPDE